MKAPTKTKYPSLKTRRHLLNAKERLLNPKNRWINAKNPWVNAIFSTEILKFRAISGRLLAMGWRFRIFAV
jgi:hypothetical protein